MAEAAVNEADDTDIDALQAEADDEARAALDDNATDAPNPEVERAAQLMGWKPLDQWKGDPSGWRSAADFLAEVPEILKRTRKSNERLEGEMARVVAQVAKLDANQRQVLDDELEREFEAAWDAADFDKAKKVRDRIKDLAKAAPEPSEPAAIQSFKSRNATWYGPDDAATAYADLLDARYLAASGGNIRDLDAHVRKVEEGVKKRFPELFVTEKTETQRQRAPLVNRGGRTDTRRQNGELTVSDLTPAQRKAAGEMNVTEAAYVKALNKYTAKESAR